MNCDGALFDGSACYSGVFECDDCGVRGCAGDGCDNQTFLTAECDTCGRHTVRALAAA